MAMVAPHQPNGCHDTIAAFRYYYDNSSFDFLYTQLFLSITIKRLVIFNYLSHLKQQSPLHHKNL
jgi:hypothetical protein